MGSKWMRCAAALLAGGALAAMPAIAQAGGLRVSNAWSRALPPSAVNGAVYLQIHNSGEPVRLIGGDTPAAQRVELHTHEVVDGLARMRKLDELDVAATAQFEPGGHHLMLMNLAEPLAAGSEFPLTLEFADGTRLATTVTVMPLDHQQARQPGMKHKH